MSKEFDLKLYNILKPLNDKYDEVLYLNSVKSDLNSMPSDYIVYRSDVVNNGFYGDGFGFFRKSTCDVICHEAGNGNNENAGYLSEAVKLILEENNICYEMVQLPYDEDADCIETTFSFELWGG
jgi:hypothetical protein